MADVFNKELKRSCSYCVFGRKSFVKGEILCLRHGVTDSRDSCRHYKYDPLKREPEQLKPADAYKPEDFSL